MKYYTIYSAKTDEVVAHGTAADCTVQLEMASVNSFYAMVSRVMAGLNKKYIIVFLDLFDDDY